MSSPNESYIASLDIGTTTLRCYIINKATEIVGSARSLTKLYYPKPGYCEIDPNELWDQVILVIKEAIENANITSKDIISLGISTQRSTFTTWRKDNGQIMHNFITWKDMRAKNLCKELNSSLMFKSFRSIAYSLYLLTRSDRFLTGSKLNIAPNHVTGRLLWVLNNIDGLKEEVEKNNIYFGTIDTWLLYKFSNCKLHVTDISNASATGFYDPFVSEWGSWAKMILKIPQNILPVIVDNDFDFGVTDPEIFGTAIPIKCVMGDQNSSMFASCCFKEDDLKVTLGTGAFLDVNSGTSIPTSVTGMYPLVGWKIDGEVTFIGEAPCNDCGSLTEWILKVDLLADPAESYEMATKVSNTDGVYFIPAFSGLAPPINDMKAATGFLGIKPTTTKNHLVRAVLESIAYRVTLAYTILKQNRNKDYKNITIDGGVSNNDFVCQLLANLTNLKVERLLSRELSALGVAFVAGLKSNIWKDKNNLINLRHVERVFHPNSANRITNLSDLDKWLKAVERFKCWYNED